MPVCSSFLIIFWKSTPGCPNMRRVKRSFIFLIFIFTAFFISTLSHAQPASLYRLFNEKVVKVYVAPIKDLSSGHDVEPALVESKLKEALKNRKSIHFVIVEQKEQAQLAIAIELKGFMWTDHDPVDMIMGLGAAALDAAKVEDYASLEADFTVSDVLKDKILWQERVRASVTKKPMPKPDSLPLVAEGLAKSFLKSCFSKKR